MPGWRGGEQGLDYWIAELQALGVKWFKLLDDNGDSIPFCQKLVKAGIFPIVRILRRDPPPNDSPEPNPGHLNAAEEETIRKLIDVGVLYFETNNEPNIEGEWKSGAIPADPLEAAKLVALNWLFDARVILDAGGYPGLPAISSGGSMDLMEALVSLDKQAILLEGCWIAVHNYGLNRPLDFPFDAVNQHGEPLTPEQYDLGPLTEWAWWNREQGCADTIDQINELRASGKNPSPSLSGDHSCFREFEYYNSLAHKYLGRSIPILSTEGGYRVGRREDPRYPRVTPQAQAELTVSMFEFMQRRAPDYYFAAVPWLMLPAEGLGPDAWYSDFWARAFKNPPRKSTFVPVPVAGLELGANLPVVSAVKGMTQVARSAEVQTSVLRAKPPAPPRFKLPPSLSQTMYTVQRGDTLSSIAKKFASSVTVIALLNNISDPSRVTVGQQLLVPVPAGSGLPVGAPEPASIPKPPPPPAPKLSGMAELDPRLSPLGVQVSTAMVVPGMLYWRLVRAVYIDSQEAGGSHDIYYCLIDENGEPVAGQRVLQAWGEGQVDALSGEDGQAMIPIWAAYAPDRGEIGPYTAWVDGLPSDRVTGLGLPQKRHVSFRLTWQRTKK